MIRRAKTDDIDAINRLLRQVLDLHAEGRPDIFISGRKKYTDGELSEIISNDRTPVFVSETEGKVDGYVFCILRESEDGNILRGRRELYIDDLCVDESSRGKNIGRELYLFTREFAIELACDAITLNVWELNAGARRFYEKCGLSPLKTVMEDKLG